MPDDVQNGEGVENQGVQGIQYGRRWKIAIYKPAYKENEKGQKEHDVEMDVSLLRCIFKTQVAQGTPVQVGILVVYNMNVATEKEVITEGFQISIEGGYEEAQYGHIYTGDIIQVIRNRENGIDYRLEILAVRSAKPFDTNHVRASVAAGSKPRDVAKAVCQQADTKLKLAEVSDKISQQPLPRGKVIFGNVGKYLRDIAIANNAWFYENADGDVELKSVNDEVPDDEVLVLGPDTGLVGTPKYTDNGIQIKMLLEPRLKLNSMVHIDNSIIQRQLIPVDQNTGSISSKQTNQNTMFDKSGEYKVLSIAHSMDTHGDDWTTEVIGLSTNGKAGLATELTESTQSAVI